MIWRWLWRTVALFLGRKAWAAWQRRRQQKAASTTSTPGPYPR
jgi:hypothetical protein